MCFVHHGSFFMTANYQQLTWHIVFQDVTLEQLLDEEDIIQECKAQNSKVIDL